MISHLILAGGKGTRLFGPGGGCKPLARVHRDAALIDYCITEAGALDVGERLLVTTPEFTNELVHRLRAATPPTRVYAVRAEGTGHAVNYLLKQAKGDHIILTTCDIAGPCGALRDFYVQALAMLDDAKEPLCVVAVAPSDPSENTPIHVRHGANGVVSAYGKSIEPSPNSFASARAMNRGFADLLRTTWKGGMTDTQTMSHVLSMGSAHMRALRTPSLFDVDDRVALERARRLDPLEDIVSGSRKQ